MRYFVVICCVLASVLAKDKKISLDDIERDNIKSEKSPRTIPQKTSGSPTTYGFLPVKTVEDYARQSPKYAPYLSQQHQTPHQYYYQQQPSVTQYQQHPSVNQYQQQYQQYENVQYVTDNSIATQQQYYTPQYVYLQQYTAPSTAIQSVVDPKGGVQYVMYVPAYVPKSDQSQNYENVVYADGQAYTVPATQYVTSSQQEQVTPAIKYAEQVPKAQEAPAFTHKKEPKSLLDSYIPSIVQIQYYKQQQARANAIQQSLKEKTNPAKSYRPTQTHHSSAESVVNYNYQTPSTTYQKYN